MLEALVVGGLTSWYLGVRAGVIAAGATAAALLVAAFVPGVTMVVYALVLAWSAALYFLGAKLTGQRPGAAALGGGAGAMLSSAFSQASSWVKKQTSGRDAK